MDIDRLVWAIEKYKRDCPFNNSALEHAHTPEQRAQAQHMIKDSRKELESVFNECVDERVRAVLMELGLTPKEPNP